MLSFLKASGIVVFTILFASQASAMCGKKPEIRLTDGSVACLYSVEATVITTTRERRGSGIKPRQTSADKGGLVIVQIPSGKPLPFKRLRRNARGLCQYYKPEILRLVPKPGFPFMSVTFLYGDTPKTTLGKMNFHPVYLDRNCRIRG